MASTPSSRPTPTGGDGGSVPPSSIAKKQYTSCERKMQIIANNKTPLHHCIGSTDTAAPKPRPIHHYTSLRIYGGGDGGGDPPSSAILYDDVDVLDTILRINKT